MSHYSYTTKINKELFLQALILLIGFFLFAFCGNLYAADDIAQRVLQNLQAANATRTTLQQKKSEWVSEKARLELFLSLLEKQADECDRQKEELEKQTKQIRLESDSMTSIIDAYKTLQDAAKQIAVVINEKLDARTVLSFPGVIPVRSDIAQTDPLSLMQSAIARLKSTQTATSGWNVEIVSGQLDGAEIAVNLLRAGDAMAWWLSLDGTTSGTAYVNDGRLMLSKIDDKELHKNIALCFSQYSGQSIPQWVGLPLDRKIGGEK